MNVQTKPKRHFKIIAPLIALVIMSAAWCAYAAGPEKTANAPLAKAAALTSSDWIIDAPRARALIAQDAVTVLDARGKIQWLKGHVPGARRVAWEDFARGEKTETSGMLKDDATLTRALQKLGVSAGRPVLVVGNPPDYWGEDGRIVWMLRELGHPRVAMIDGGQNALAKAGQKMSHSPGDDDSQKGAKRGDFVAKSSDALSISRDALKARLGADGFVALDTREPREFAGKTPYGESRGGHVSGAMHLFYKDLIRPDGRLLAPQAIKAKLAALGIEPDTEVAAYCTGGVRAGWVVVIMQHLGYSNARNYAGSMWDWSAQDAADYPLQK